MITRQNSPAPWVIVSSGFHFTAGQAKAVAGLADYLGRSEIPVHLVGNTFDPGLIARPGVIAHRAPWIRGADVVGNVILRRVGGRLVRKVTREFPAARVVVNGGNCQWGDVNWVHYLHHAWRPNPLGVPPWFKLKEALVSSWYRQTEKTAIKAARVVVVNSHRTREDVIQHLGAAAERVKVVYYGADPTWQPPTAAERAQAREQFGLASDRPTVVFVAGFGYDNRKGFDTLLTAWEELCRSPAWDADLLMAGSGKALGKVEERIRAAGLETRIRLLGFVDRVFELLAGADLLVSPVRYEAYGLNVQEALCRGVPAIVSQVAGVAEHYPSDLADFVLPNADDPMDLAQRLRHWRSNLEGWKTRFAPLSELVRSRTWDDMAREILSVVGTGPV